MFLGLGGQLFLGALAFNREWSLPPWPLFGALFVMTLATSVAALYTRVAALHAAGVLAAAIVLGIWTTAAGAAPWPSVALAAIAVLALYALAWIAAFRRTDGEEAAASGAGAVLVAGVLTTLAASAALVEAPPPLAAVAVSYAAHFAILLALTWWRQWPRMAIFAAVVGAFASFACNA